MDKLTSRKLWLAIIGAVFAVLADQFGIGPAVVEQVLYFVGSGILGLAAVDVAKALKKGDA